MRLKHFAKANFFPQMCYFLREKINIYLTKSIEKFLLYLLKRNIFIVFTILFS